ncbi:phage tail-collar fiber domain-containing protein [Rodentibacter pneumotropicus]|uniref:phage tail-collar fiber domain-containing protein n=1 Tax=Rodentibacter pneumotropicus TaxID=758 RepID=UPI0009877F82|nr:phage tail protein [Rodentibacter pneumotropicus]
MASQYFAILTDYGTTAFAKALSSKQPLQLTTFAVGDGNGRAVTPTANRTALVREKHRAPVSAVSLDPRNNKQVIVELTIPENVGGFYIREMGVFDNQNKLVAYANCPESFKPTESSGSGKVQVLRMILKVSSSDAVTLSIDHSVIFVTRQQLNPKTITAETQNGFDESGHTHEIDRANTAKAGIVQLSNDDNSDDETKAPTLKAIKKLKGLYDGLRRLLDSYIPNSKKSNAVNSPSSETIATSAAVKFAYDKADTAQTTANNANNNANARASKRALSSSDDLNNVAASGIYGQHANVNATPAHHYPIQQAGMLIVTEYSGYGAQQLYAPFNAGYLYARGRNASNGWDDWKRIDGLDKVSKSGDTMTGNLTINHSEPRVHGNRNNTNNWYVGLPNGSSNDLNLHSYAHNTSLILLSDRVRATKPLYVGSDSVALTKDFTYQKIGDIEVRKYPDGTMLQTCRKRMLTGDYSKVNFNWAIAFTEMPILTATAQYLNSVGDHDTIITFVQGTSNTACHLVCGETHNNSGEIAYVNIVAIGRYR